MRFLFIFLLLPLSLLRADEPRHSVLFLIADDLNCNLGCYGSAVKTPNLDKLAARGVKFERAYCQLPLCSPSRASLLSGRRPDTTRVLTNPKGDKAMTPHLRDALPDTVTLPQLFKQNGIPSIRIGKLYHAGVPLSIGTGSADDFGSWDFTFNPRGCDRDDLDDVITLVPGQYGGTVSWLSHPEPDAAHTDGKSAAEAVAQLEKHAKAGTPFFLAVGFFRPHTPYVAPAEYFKGYPADKVELPVLSEMDKAREPAPAYASAKKEQDRMTDEQRRLAIQAYHASITFMDAQAGMVLDALDRLSLRGRTTVVFTSDHGYHLGDHGLWQKQSLFERSARVPLIIDSPLTKARGAAAPGVVELIDLYPTLADLAGLKAPDYLEGKSLRPVLEDPQHRVKQAAITQVLRNQNNSFYSVRTERWRLTAWPAGPLLFDFESKDPEARSVAAEHPEVVKELSALLPAVSN